MLGNMKKLLALLVLLTLGTVVSQAQITTNVTLKWTISYVTATNTNTVNATFNINPGTANRDTNRGLGLTYAYNAYTNSLGTNHLSADPFETWIKKNYTALVDNYSSQAQSAVNAITAQKITLLLTSESDLLSNSDLSNLATIAAKAQ